MSTGGGIPKHLFKLFMSSGKLLPLFTTSRRKWSRSSSHSTCEKSRSCTQWVSARMAQPGLALNCRASRHDPRASSRGEGGEAATVGSQEGRAAHSTQPSSWCSGTPAQAPWMALFSPSARLSVRPRVGAVRQQQSHPAGHRAGPLGHVSQLDSGGRLSAAPLPGPLLRQTPPAGELLRRHPRPVLQPSRKNLGKERRREFPVSSPFLERHAPILPFNPVSSIEHQLVAAGNTPRQLHDGQEVGRRGLSSPAPLQRAAVRHAQEIGHLPPGETGQPLQAFPSAPRSPPASGVG